MYQQRTSSPSWPAVRFLGVPSLSGGGAGDARDPVTMDRALGRPFDRPRRRALALTLTLTVVVAVLCAEAHGLSAAAAPSDRPGPHDRTIEARTEAVWQWPLPPPRRIAHPYVAPVHDYAAGHRGIDIQPLGDDAGGRVVTAPADGVIAFAGRVVDRSVVTIDHGDGLVSTVEPVEPLWPAGTAVRAGEPIAHLSVGGHTTPGNLHLGARRHGRYLNPLALLGDLPRAVLLPLGSSPAAPGAGALGR